jgi:Zn-dependent protease
MLAAITADTAKFAVYLGVGLIGGLLIREDAKAQAATRLGDMTPKLYGRATLRPKPHFDPLGTGILPGFLLLLVASGLRIAPFAYAKPMPLSPERLRNPNRDIIWVSLAGPGANLAVAIVAGLLLRLTGFGSGEIFVFLAAVLQANIVLCVFHLMPIPGLDASRILARFLHGRAREVYSGLDQFLPLFMIVIYFLLSAPVLAFVRFIGNALCQPIAGFNCL